ncbi:hypothetical protein [uncultured Jatrophihabitans sp.]|uniref:hypothetical protein n=1 Tax=uncultured Jatrophihabitans sp. TaxID=1610747 RepID=UPI0035CBE6B8
MTGEPPAADASGGPGADGRSLLLALQEWAQRTLPAPPSGHPGPECQWCPLCQLASVLRGEHPELTDRMSEAAAAVSTAVKALLESSANPPSGASDGAGRASDVPAERPQPRPRVQRIVLDDETPQG